MSFDRIKCCCCCYCCRSLTRREETASSVTQGRGGWGEGEGMGGLVVVVFSNHGEASAHNLFFRHPSIKHAVAYSFSVSFSSSLTH